MHIFLFVANCINELRVICPQFLRAKLHSTLLIDLKQILHQNDGEQNNMSI